MLSVAGALGGFRELGRLAASTGSWRQKERVRGRGVVDQRKSGVACYKLRLIKKRAVWVLSRPSIATGGNMLTSYCQIHQLTGQTSADLLVL